jgi:hypothetical protein
MLPKLLWHFEQAGKRGLKKYLAAFEATGSTRLTELALSCGGAASERAGRCLGGSRDVHR